MIQSDLAEIDESTLKKISVAFVVGTTKSPPHFTYSATQFGGHVEGENAEEDDDVIAELVTQFLVDHHIALSEQQKTRIKTKGAPAQ